MNIYISDDEKGENIKRWWDDNGIWVIFIIISLAGVILIGNYWSNHQKFRVENAANIYQQVTNAIAEGRERDAQDKHEILLSQFPSTPYAVFSSFEMVKLTLDSDIESAKSHLRWIIFNSILTGHVEIALLRLAKIFLVENNLVVAISLIDKSNSLSFVSLFYELRGDIFAKKGKSAEALSAYKNAMLKLVFDAPRRSLLSIKIDDMSVGDDS